MLSYESYPPRINLILVLPSNDFSFLHVLVLVSAFRFEKEFLNHPDIEVLPSQGIPGSVVGLQVIVCLNAIIHDALMMIPE